MQLVAHRGNAGDCPENTLPAFASALALGARHLELDVQLSADRVPMVIHDATLRRTTGRSGRVCHRTAAELTAIEAAERPRFGARYAGTTIPRLTDVLALMRSSPEVTLFVEIKKESFAPFGRHVVTRRVVDAIASDAAQCVVISFDLEAVRMARAFGCLRIGWVLPRYGRRTHHDALALAPDFLFVDHKRLPARGPLWSGPWAWVVYEVDRVPLARRLMARGVGLLETMAVARMTPRSPGSSDPGILA